jgi:hypothetical protein
MVINTIYYLKIFEYFEICFLIMKYQNLRTFFPFTYFEDKPAALSGSCPPMPPPILVPLVFLLLLYTVYEFPTLLLQPPLFCRKSIIIIVILSEPIPSFYLISSNVAGHISSRSLWFMFYISLIEDPCWGNICLKYYIIWSDVLQSHIPSQANTRNSISLCICFTTTSGNAVTIWLFKNHEGYASFGGLIGL